MEIDDVKPNDVPAAVRFAREAIAGGWWDGDWAESLLNKQTQPAKLSAALQKLPAGARADGTGLARSRPACNSRSMAKRRTQRTDDGSTDPNDEASREARGANTAPVEGRDDEGEGGGDEGAEGGDEGAGGGEAEMDAYSASCDDDGNLTDAARGRMAAKNFAVPDKERLPIHDPAHVQAAMKKFGEHPFDDADEKHAAFNRIVSRAKEFGVNSARFQRANNAKLDRAAGPRSDTSMTADEIKKLQARADKADARKTARDEARTRADAAEKTVKELEGKVAGLEGQVKSLTTDLETAKKGHLDSAAIDKVVAARAGLLAVNREFGVPKFDALDSPEIVGLDPVAIKRAFIKHVDKDDVPADKHPEFVEALYQGALKRARADAAATRAGAAALGLARGAGGGNAAPVVPPDRNDGAGAGNQLPTEAEIAARQRNDSNNAWARPGNATALQRGGY